MALFCISLKTGVKTGKIILLNLFHTETLFPKTILRIVSKKVLLIFIRIVINIKINLKKRK